MTLIVPFNRTHHLKRFAFDARFAVKLHIEAADFGSDFTGYSVLINKATDATLTNMILDADGMSPALNGGGDLRVVTDPENEATRLAIDVTKFVINNNPLLGEMELWLEAGTVSSITGVDIYLLWGIPGAVQPARNAPFGAEATWNQPSGPDWRVVSHLNDLTLTTTEDITPSNNVMAKNAVGQPVETSNVPFDSSRAQDFTTGLTSYIDTVHSTSLSVGAVFTAMWWFRMVQSPVGNEIMVSKKTTSGALTGWHCQFQSGIDNRIRMRSSNSVIRFWDVIGVDWSDGSWNHLILRFNGTGVELILNGIVQGTEIIANVLDNTENLVMGLDTSHINANFTGSMDEFRQDADLLSIDNCTSIYKGQNDPGSHVTATIL